MVTLSSLFSVIKLLVYFFVSHWSMNLKDVKMNALNKFFKICFKVRHVLVLEGYYKFY